MFRTENNIPQNYIEESRDFQLLSRLYDLTYNGLRYNIDSMINLNDPMKINDQFLPLLGTKVGFITDKNIEVNLWRYILSSFQYSLKYKGSIKGVRNAVSSILLYEGKTQEDIKKIEYNSDTNVIYIYVSRQIDNIEALDEYLRYILPAGCVYEITQALQLNTTATSTVIVDQKVNTSAITAENYSSIFNSSDFDRNQSFPLTYKTNNQATEMIQINSTNTLKSRRSRNVKE